MPYLRFFSAFSSAVASAAVGGGYATLFLVTFLEGVPLIGVIVPGHVAVIAAGFIAATGVLNVWYAILVSVVAAIAGDYMSFWFGRRYGWPLVERLRPRFFLRDEHIEKARELISKNTGKALLIGRFNPVTRGIMPFLVGAAETPAASFWIFNCIGAVLWVVGSVGIGYALGLGYHAAAGIVGRLVVVAVIAGILIIWGYRYANSRFHIFRIYELIALGLNLIAIYTLARMIQDAFAAHSFMATFDVWVNTISANVAVTLTGLKLASAALFVSDAGGVIAVTVGTVLIGLYLVFRKRWRSSLILLVSVGSTALIVGWMKDFFLRVRPADSLIPALASDPSFPSAHAAFIAAFCVAVAYIAAPRIRSWVLRDLFLSASVLVVILVGLSRLVLNVHWASDVIAGWSVGIFCATAAILLVKYVGEFILPKARPQGATMPFQPQIQPQTAPQPHSEPKA